MMKVYYATDRQAAGIKNGHPEYASARTKSKQDIAYGYVAVSVPASHKKGQMVSDPYWEDWFGKREPAKYIEIQKGEQLTEAQLTASLATGTSKSVLLFVHGYNNTFDEAAERTAQIGYDTKFPGKLMFFSWPSLGDVDAYPADAANEGWGSLDLAQVLQVIDRSSDVANLTIIAHSMGNQMLADAFQELASIDPTLVRRVGHIVMAAPDVDAGQFTKQFAKFFQSAPHTTLYVSSTDKALAFSHGYHRVDRRLGDFAAGPMVYPPIDTIDVTAVSTSFIGHAYLADSPVVLGDIAIVMTSEMPPAHRPHMVAAKNSSQQQYWHLMAGASP
jgi:esterase/lipase superfamily enzyme